MYGSLIGIFSSIILTGCCPYIFPSAEVAQEIIECVESVDKIILEND